jgi:hypothetical protein
MSPTVTLFWMNGCGACEHNKPAWTEFKKLCKGKVTTREVESANVKESDNISGFPTMRIEGGTSITGARESGKEIADALGLKLKGGHRTRRQRSRRLTRRKHLRIA